MRMLFINIFFPQIVFNSPKNAEFKDAALHPGLGNTPPCISNKWFFFPPCAYLALPLKMGLAHEQGI